MREFNFLYLEYAYCIYIVLLLLSFGLFLFGFFLRYSLKREESRYFESQRTLFVTITAGSVSILNQEEKRIFRALTQVIFKDVSSYTLVGKSVFISEPLTPSEIECDVEFMMSATRVNECYYSDFKHSLMKKVRRRVIIKKGIENMEGQASMTYGFELSESMYLKLINNPSFLVSHISLREYFLPLDNGQSLRTTSFVVQ